MRGRAAAADQTRRRIIEAAVALYQARGPADTTISAVAAHAGVERLTVYRHFPDERLLVKACWDYWALLHPLPPLQRWKAIGDPRQRLRAGLDALYIYYDAAGSLLERFLSDRARMPALDDVMEPFDKWLTDVRAHLLEGWGAHGRPREWIIALVDHAISFTTWASLSRSGILEPGEPSRLLCRAVADLARDAYGRGPATPPPDAQR